VLADHFGASDPREREKDPLKARAFGTAGDEGNSGSLVFTDARIVCIPIRSFSGAFAWVTSPLCLIRLARDIGSDTPIPSVEKNEEALVISENSRIVLEGSVYLEELDFAARSSAEADPWADHIAKGVFGNEKDWMKTFKERFVIVHDDVFSFFCETGTEVAARVRINDETKTVASGALWYEDLSLQRPFSPGLYGATKSTAGKIPKTAPLRKCLSISAPLLFTSRSGERPQWERVLSAACSTREKNHDAEQERYCELVSYKGTAHG
jgi:hypothetical protein